MERLTKFVRKYINLLAALFSMSLGILCLIPPPIFFWAIMNFGASTVNFAIFAFFYES